MRTLLAIVALATMLFPAVGSAQVRIANDPGGNVMQYIAMYRKMRAAGEHIVIDGTCLSACTLLTGIIPQKNICVTSEAMLGFHMASFYDDVSRSFVPTRRGSDYVMSRYPTFIRSWINAHGGLTPQIIMMHAGDLARVYPLCH